MAKIPDAEKDAFWGLLVAGGGLLTPKHRKIAGWSLWAVAGLIGIHMIWTAFQPEEKSVPKPSMKFNISGHHNSIGSADQSGGQAQNAPAAKMALQIGGNAVFNMDSKDLGGENLKIEPVRRHDDNHGRPFDQFSLAITNIGNGKVVFKKGIVFCDGKEVGSRDRSEGFEGAVGSGEIWSEEDPIFFDPKNRNNLAHWQQCRGEILIEIITSRDNNFRGVLKNQ